MTVLTSRQIKLKKKKKIIHRSFNTQFSTEKYNENHLGVLHFGHPPYNCCKY